MKTLSYHKTLPISVTLGLSVCIFILQMIDIALFLDGNSKTKKKEKRKLSFFSRKNNVLFSSPSTLSFKKEGRGKHVTVWSEGADGQSNSRLIDWLISCCLIDINKLSVSILHERSRRIRSELSSQGAWDEQSPCLDSRHIQTWASIWLFTSVFIKAEGLFDVFITFLFTQLSLFISPENNPFAIDWHEGNKSWS